MCARGRWHNLLLERTVTWQSWIAERLAMRNAANLSQPVPLTRLPVRMGQDVLKEFLNLLNLTLIKKCHVKMLKRLLHRLFFPTAKLIRNSNINLVACAPKP
jgi:hypothetical protein